MKHAYLIITHSSYDILCKLICALDDTRNDIYIHIDKKANFDGTTLRTEKSKLVILSNRLDARWGDYSLVKVELMLFEEAHNNGPYGYYHLISGVDFPLKSQDFIHNFCDKYQGTEFIGFAKTTQNEIRWRSQHYFPFSRFFKSKNILIRFIRSSIARFQSIINYSRSSLVIKKGCQWCSITDELVKYILDNKKLIHQIFNHTYCPDEMFVQTLCWNSKFRDRIYDINDEFNGCKRFIVWNNGVLKMLDDVSPDILFSSDKLFGRKFSDKGINIINSRYKQII